MFVRIRRVQYLWVKLRAAVIVDLSVDSSLHLLKLQQGGLLIALVIQEHRKVQVHQRV